MAKTIVDVLSSNGYAGDRGFKKFNGDVGIEIETEASNPYEPPHLKYWSSHADGSLRNFGIEYVLKGPVGRGKECREALEEWDNSVRKKFKLIPDSFSTSVHVHINFLNNTWLELWNFLCTYYLVENLLIRIAGETRRSNLFCLPLCDAEGELQSITSLISNIGSFRHGRLKTPPENYKYAALNICNLTNLGTMEVRSLKGTTNINEIEKWINILLSIKDFSCREDINPAGIVELADQIGVEILYQIFGEYVTEFNDIKNKEELLKKNMYYVAKISSSSKFTDRDWGFPKPKKVYKEKMLEELEKISLEMFKCEYKQLIPMYRIVVEETLARSLNLQPKDVIFADGDQ